MSRIVEARVIVTCPGRNFVTLKIVTDDGVHGLAQWWAGTNLDGGFAVDDVEISAGDIERVSAWMEETYQNAGY